MERREFLKATLAATALAAGFKSAAAATGAPSGRDLYELRVYRLAAGATSDLLEGYLEKALIPALNRRGITPVGAFRTIASKNSPAAAPLSPPARSTSSAGKPPAVATTIDETPAITLLIPYSSVDALLAAADLDSDPAVQAAAPDYLTAPTMDHPAFERIDSWLLLAFTGMPRLELPPSSRARAPRIFEIRTYASFSEAKARKKIELFNTAEMGVQREVGLAPVLYGQALIGANLPHLTYFTSATDREAHKRHWAAFGKHPVWVKAKADPQYADAVSKITSTFVVPTAYSQI